jgi:Flp pilus assembly protein TadB
VGKTYEEANEIKQALELERRRQQAVMEKEKKEKLEAAKAKADRQREKAQQKIAVRAQRQAEPDVNQPLRGLKAPLQPDVLLIIGSVVVALIGIGLLVWQLG